MVVPVPSKRLTPVSAAHLIANRGPPTSAGQGIVSAIIVIHSYMARKNPAPATSTNSASRVSGMIDPRTAPPHQDLMLLDLGRIVAPRPEP